MVRLGRVLVLAPNSGSFHAEESALSVEVSPLQCNLLRRAQAREERELEVVANDFARMSAEIGDDRVCLVEVEWIG